MSAFVDEPLLLNELARKAGGLFVSVAATAIGARLLWYTTPTELPQQARESFNGPAKSNAIVAFYNNEIKTNEGRDSATWQEIIGTFGTNGKFERCHHFMQWLFPTSFPSKYNSGAPLLNKSVIVSIYNDQVLLGRFKESVRFFLGQLGITLDGIEYKTQDMSINNPTKLELMLDGHIAMRISRFMRSCCCFSVPQYAWKLYVLLLGTAEIRSQIDTKTQKIWSHMLQNSGWTWIDIDTEMMESEIVQCIEDIKRLLQWYETKLITTAQNNEVRRLLESVLARYWNAREIPSYAPSK